VLAAEVVEVANEGERLELGAGLGREVAREVAQTEHASLRAMQEAQRLGERAQRHRLVEHQRVDRAATQALLGHQVLEHGEGGRQRRHAGARLRHVGGGVEARLDQDAAPVEPGPATSVQLDLAKKQRVAAPEDDEVDDEELAGVAQAVELLRVARRRGDVVAQRHRRERIQRGLDLRERRLDGVVGDDRDGVDIGEPSAASNAALPPSHAASTASLRSSACRSTSTSRDRVTPSMAKNTRARGSRRGSSRHARTTRALPPSARR
jgi:hypothetical protein